MPERRRQTPADGRLRGVGDGPDLHPIRGRATDLPSSLMTSGTGMGSDGPADEPVVTSRASLGGSIVTTVRPEASARAASSTSAGTAG